MALIAIPEPPGSEGTVGASRGGGAAQDAIQSSPPAWDEDFAGQGEKHNKGQIPSERVFKMRVTMRRCTEPAKQVDV